LNNLETVCLWNNAISNFFPETLIYLCDQNVKCTVKITATCFSSHLAIPTAANAYAAVATAVSSASYFKIPFYLLIFSILFNIL